MSVKRQPEFLGQQSELPWTETSGTQKGTFPQNPPLNVVRPSSRPSVLMALPPNNVSEERS